MAYYIVAHDDFFQQKALAAIKADRDRGLKDGDYSVESILAIKQMADQHVEPGDERFTQNDITLWEAFYFVM